MALRWFALLALASLAACANPGAPQTAAMGAGPSCDLRIDIGADHSCPVRHVAPDEGEQLITNGTHTHD
ncbi:MAG TPA: hypothetical protein VL593_12115 [Ramlibacter sp.]|jgi:hypothetical protein|nr:hypothetical protein [Ramlibacter sp.]